MYTAYMKTLLIETTCCKSDEVAALFCMKIHKYYRNSDQFSNPFCLNIGTKYHVIPHTDIGQLTCE